MFIASQEKLEEFVSRAQNSSVLAIDTEFLREKTYYARLCLIQVCIDDETVVIDPFAVRDLSVLKPLLLNEAIVKLFHAASQDLEIIYRELGVLPRPIFDTQIAATVMGYSQQVGYAALVSSECDVQLRKLESFTDWSQRPLSDSQLKYAADDVVYLPKIYRKMKAALEKKGRLQWLDEDFKNLSNPAKYEHDERERFRRLKRVSQLSRKQLSAAREVTAWRELEAQRRDIPRKWVITDEQIVEMCKREARSLDDLFMVRGLRDRLSTKDARTILGLIKTGIKLPKEEWPELDRNKKNEPNVDTEIDLMTAIARVRSKEYDIALQTLAPHDELARLARGYRKEVLLLHGWRKALLGDELLRLLDGDICLRLNKGRLEVEETSQTSDVDSK
ncbi:MAG: ribonuclease D [Raoultibacter sp.]